MTVELKKIKTQINGFLLVVLLIFIFFLSIYLSPKHIYGDQIYYTKAYSAVKGLNFFDALNKYRTIIIAFEPAHFIVVWLASNIGFEKNIFMSFLNVVLAILGYKYFRLNKFSSGIAIIILVSNYYFYVLFFTLEKLKISFIFLLLFLVYKDRVKYAIVSFFISLVAHFQMFILAFAKIMADLFQKEKIPITLKRIPKLFFSSIFILVFGLLLLSIMLRFTGGKIWFYILENDNRSVFSVLSAILICIIALLCTKYRTRVIVYFSLISVFIVVFGSDRLNMFVYFGFLYFVDPERMVSKVAVFSISAYFFLKSIEYLTRIYYLGG